MADQTYQTGKTAADNLYQANTSSVSTAGSTQAKGTGQFVDLKTPKFSPQPAQSLAEAADKAKKAKSAQPKKAVKTMGEFRKGGKVKKTGIYKIHKGERVLNPKQTKKAEKSSAMKQILSGK